jgi:predicted naringenin-chalcone synthase
MSYITAIGTANPPHRFEQATIAGFMVKAMKLDAGESRKLRTIFKAAGITTRYSVLEDYGKTSDFTFFSNTPNGEPFPATDKRMALFQQHALSLSLAAIENLCLKAPDADLKSITHLVVVTCTGMYAPGLDIELVDALGLSSSVQRTCITFMGCYAAFNALKVANAFCMADSNSKVLVVCTELCSIHFQHKPTDDNILANALFADGSSAVLVQGHKHGPKGLKCEAFHNDFAIEGQQDMAWQIGNHGFEMKLSSYVPDIIQKGIGDLTARLLQKINIDISDIQYFAIHPGGRKILEAIEAKLGISREQNAFAYRVLADFGNMSSVTVLFVLNEILEKVRKEDQGAHILSFAFGPGLTLESMLLSIETR